MKNDEWAMNDDECDEKKVYGIGKQYRTLYNY